MLYEKLHIRRWHVVLILFVLTMSMYLPVAGSDIFCLDDHTLIDYAKSFSSGEKPLTAIFRSNYLGSSYYRPLTTLSFIMDSNVWGDVPAGAHITNVILHFIVSSLFFLLLRHFSFPLHVSALCAMVFAALPIHVNAVGWIAGRNDLLGGLFAILAILMYKAYERKRSAVYLLMFSIFLTAGVLAKEHLLLLPVLVLFLHLLTGDKRTAASISAVSLSSVIPFIFYYALRSQVSADIPWNHASFTYDLRNLHQIPEILASAVSPFGITPLPMRDVSGIVLGSLFLFIWLAAGIVSSVRQKDFKPLGGLLAFIVFLLPGLMVFPSIHEDAHYWDCRSYVPLLGLIFSCASFIDSHPAGKKRGAYFFIIIIIAVFAVTTNIKSRDYSSGEKFWKKVEQKFPGKPTGLFGAFHFYMRNERTDEAHEVAVTYLHRFPGRYAAAREFAREFERREQPARAASILIQSLHADCDSAYTYDLLRNLTAAGDFKRFHHYFVTSAVTASGLSKHLTDYADFYRKTNRIRIQQNLLHGAELLKNYIKPTQ